MLKNFEEELNRFGKEVIKRARYNLTRGKHKSSGQLYKNLTYEFTKNADGYLFEFKYPEYGDYIDQGVSGTEEKYPTPFKYTSKKPPYKSILGWVKAKKVRFRDPKGRFEAGNYKTIAAIIRNSIFKKGIKPTLFFTKPFTKRMYDLPDNLTSALLKDYNL